MTTQTTAAAAEQAVRTYGGWRQARGWGLWGLTQGQTLLVLGAILTPIMLFVVSWRAALMSVGPAAIIAAAAAVKIDGVPGLHLVLRRIRFWRAARKGYTSYQAGVLVEHPEAWRLPGALAATELLSVEDVTGQPYGLVWNQRSGELTATLRCASMSMALVDPQVADGWVARWHGWLARLGHEPTVTQVAVTIDAAPEPGSRLESAVRSAMVDDAPPDAVDLLEELIAKSPSAAADVNTRVSVTFDPDAGPRNFATQVERAAEVSRVLRGLESGLAGCGVAVKGRATAAQIAGWVRVAHDPDSRGPVTAALNNGQAGLLTWGGAGPIGARERWRSYLHDGGLSASLVWRAPPSGVVPASVLEELLTPKTFATRVSLLYRPLPARDVARHVDDEVNAATFRDALRAKQGRDQTARDQADHDRAVQAAREEAQGAGMVRCDLYVTVTVPHGNTDELDEAIATIDAAAGISRIELRPLDGAQQAGFQSTLGVGVVPSALARKARR